jgi:uncharacterized protein YjdB
MQRTTWFVGLLVLVCSCTPSVKTVTVDPETETLEAKGARATFRALPKDGNGQRVSDPRLVAKWSTSAPLVASIEENGKVTALRSGEAVITAVVGEVKGEGKVKVTIPGTVTITPAALELKAAGETASLEVRVTDDAGQPLRAKRVDWESSDPTVARVINGQVTAVGPGAVTVTATMDVIKGTAKVTVKRQEVPQVGKLVLKPANVKLRKGKSAKLSVVVLDKKGKPVGDAPVTWKSSNQKIAKVDAGLVTAVKKGKAKVTVSAGRKTATTKVTVK